MIPGPDPCEASDLIARHRIGVWRALLEESPDELYAELDAMISEVEAEPEPDRSAALHWRLDTPAQGAWRPLLTRALERAATYPGFPVDSLRDLGALADDQRNRLFVAFMGWAYYRLGWQRRRNQDATQEALIGLLAAIERFRPDRVTDPATATRAFLAYARHYVEGYWRQAARSDRPAPHPPARWGAAPVELDLVQVDDELYEEDDGPVLVEDTIAAPEPEVEIDIDAELDALEAAPPARLKITAQDVRCVRALYGIGCERRTLREIGADVGMSAERVRQRTERVLAVLRRRLSGDPVRERRS